MATDERELIRSICPNEGKTVIEDDPNILFFRLAPEVSPCVRTFLETRGWVDLSYLQLHPTDPCRMPPKALLANKDKNINIRKTMSLLLKAKKSTHSSSSSDNKDLSSSTAPTDPASAADAQNESIPLKSTKIPSAESGATEKDGLSADAGQDGGVSDAAPSKPKSRFAFGARDAHKPKRDLEYYKQVPGIWNLWWEDSGFLPLLYSLMNSSQSLNHLPTLSTVYRKDNLALTMMMLTKKYGQEVFGITPETYLVPTQYTKFKAAFLETYHKTKKTYLATLNLPSKAHRTDDDSYLTPPALIPVTPEAKNNGADIKAKIDGADDDDSGLLLPLSELPVWIAKPVAGARGQGIFLFRTLRELDAKWAQAHGKAPFVIQRYLANPLLVGEVEGKESTPANSEAIASTSDTPASDLSITSSTASSTSTKTSSKPVRHKFDLRLYALVESNWPFRLHLHRRGMVRFSSQPYNDDISDTLAHLTNFSLNKDKEEGGEVQEPGNSVDGSEIPGVSKNRRVSSKGINYDRPTNGPSGCKWDTADLFEYLSSETSINPHQLWLDIKHAITKALLPVVSAAVTNSIDYSSGYDTRKSDPQPNSDSLSSGKENGKNYQCPNLVSTSSLSLTPQTTPALPCTCRHASVSSLASRVNHSYAGYELIGVDVMIDEQGKVFIVELNRSPAMMVSTDVDRYVKSKVLHDVFNMLKIEATLLAAKRNLAKRAASDAAAKTKTADEASDVDGPVTASKDAVVAEKDVSEDSESATSGEATEFKFKPTVAWQYYHSSKPADMKQLHDDSTNTVADSKTDCSKALNRYLSRCNVMKPTPALLTRMAVYDSPHEFDQLFPLNIYTYIDVEMVIRDMTAQGGVGDGANAAPVCPNQYTPDYYLDFLEKEAVSGKDVSKYIPSLGNLLSAQPESNVSSATPLPGIELVQLLRQLWNYIEECNLATHAAYVSAVENDRKNNKSTPEKSPITATSPDYPASFRARVDAVQSLQTISGDNGKRSLAASLIPSLPLAMQVKHQHEKSVYLDEICRYFVWWEKNIQSRRTSTLAKATK